MLHPMLCNDLPVSGRVGTVVVDMLCLWLLLQVAIGPMMVYKLKQ